MEIEVINGKNPSLPMLNNIESSFDFSKYEIDNLWFLAIIDTSNEAVNT